LYSSAKDRESLDSLGDLYSILVATEALERAYLRDAISAQECVNMRCFGYSRNLRMSFDARQVHAGVSPSDCPI
jgi:hypothetical protein